VLLAALALFLLFAPFANPLRNVVFDGYQRIFPLEREASHVAVVVIDEEALARYGQWPWPRTRMAELIERLAQSQPAAIGLDLLFAEPDRFSPGMIAAEMPIIPSNLAKALQALPSNDERFAGAIRGHNVVLGIASQDIPDSRFPDPPRAAPVVTRGENAANLVAKGGHLGNLPELESAAAGRGLMDAGQADQVVRVVPLVERVQGAIVPSLGVETLRVALDAGIRLDDAPAGLTTIRFGEVSARMQDDGTTWLRIGHELPDTLSAYEVLSGKADPDRLRGKLVLVGISGLGVQDFKTTSVGDFVPGVNLHAQVIENLINGTGLVRPAVMIWAEAAAFVLCGLLLIGLVPRLSALQGINLVVVLVLLLFLVGITAFRHFQLLFDFAWPAIGTIAVFVSVVVGTLSEAERQRRQLREQAAHMAGEVDAARRIQMGLLPDPREALASDRRFKLSALLEPARTVGEMLVRAQAEIEHENAEQLFVTGFAAVLDASTGELEFSSAGHEPPFVRTPRGAPERFATPEGPPLCVMPGFRYATGRRQMQAGEWLCVVTDGATEAMNPKRQFFGVERLRASLSWMPEDAGPGEIVRRLRDDVARFAAGAEPADDITLLAIRWTGAAPRG